MKRQTIFIVLIFLYQIGYSQELSLKVYSDTIYASNDYELFNRISYGITNNTNQKQLFIIDNKGLRYSDFSFDAVGVDIEDLNMAYYALNHQMVVKDEKGQEVGLNDCIVSRGAISFFNKDIVGSSRNEKLFFEEYLSKYIVIIDPGEEYFISKYNMLPSHLSEGNTYVECLDMLDGKDYIFNVVISQSTDYIEAILPKDYLKELEKDNVNIFNGVLTSNDGYVKWVE